MKKKLFNILRAAGDLIWPPVCAGCGAALSFCDAPSPLSFYCPDCLAAIEFMPRPSCPLCGRPYWAAQSHICGDCLADPPPYHSARSALVYGGEAAHSILKLKYYGALNQAAALAALCRERMDAMDISRADMLIPMPLTAPRLARRGYNQALELAAALYTPPAPPIRTDILERVRDGNARLAALASAGERRKAVRGCFRVSAAAGEGLRGARVLLFDDILTTGATAAEAAKTLLAAGAARVELRTVARAVPDRWR
jgi:ComF family protein